MQNSNINFGYSFPAIRGVQAGQEYYVSMCPMRLLPKLFLFNEQELPPEVRAQRRLNRVRLPEMAKYIRENTDSYVFSAITASVDGEISFSAVGKRGDAGKIGVLSVGMDAKFIINDGQHRRAAIEMAMEQDPAIGDETIAVVLFLDPKLKRCQQIFSDLNRYAIRPSPSLGILYDHRDAKAMLTKKLVGKGCVFGEFVEMEKSTLSARSRRLFTLSAIYNGTNELLSGRNDEDDHTLAQVAIDYWTAVTSNIKEWKQVFEGKILASEVRNDFIHSHAIVLQALGRAGNALLANHPQPKEWKKTLKVLGGIDWSRNNRKLWSGRVISAGRVSKGEQNVVLTTNLLKQKMNLPLSREEKRVEMEFQRS